ncbi:MAG: 23S rRNA (guanosine(2251)-2'-O)-methyltransferase RlmB [Desulfobacterales bacterium]|nr:MAG: 23S rRNA (guanosine(2251)-2'-O)-methyltransferase RlmB [Desulfobacterales bacterium]
MSGQKKGERRGRERRIRYSDELIWGVHPVHEAIRTAPDKIVELVLQKDRHGRNWQGLIEDAQNAGIKCRFVERIKITGVSAGQIRHQGVIARGASVSLLSFDTFLRSILEKEAGGEKPKIIACDSIQDPHNIGAIIRSAHAAGIDHALLTRERSAPVAGIASKSSAGALSKVEICQVTNLTTSLQRLKEAGVWVFGAVKDKDAQSIYRTDFDLPACLVVGNEGQGIRPLVRRQCDVLISIPMAGSLDSLNSSVAAAVIMFEMHRQRLARDEV